MKGVEYKQGPVPTMMIAIANKDNWKVEDSKTTAPAVSPKAPSQPSGSASPTPPTPPTSEAATKKVTYLVL